LVSLGLWWLALTVIALLFTASGAEAAYPGQKGRIAFLSNRGGGGYKLFTMRMDGSDVRLVTNRVAADSPPSWSPDGRRLVYTTAGGLLATIGESGARRRVFPFPGWWGTWSPDRVRIAFANEADGIDTVAARGGRPVTLLADQGAGDVSKWQPSWSPDGERVAFVAGEGAGSGAIWTVKADGRRPKRLTNGDALGEIDLAPDWSPDGRLIAFERFVECRGGACKSAIFTIPATGGKAKLVARNAAKPSWSPDGRQIVFVRRSTSSDIWVMNADGSGAHRLTTSDASELAPDWQPRP
jgi:Tol biopolymer transport system component